MLSRILINWETSGAAACVALAGVLVAFGVITEAQGVAIAAAATSLGLLLARDADKSSQDNGVRPPTSPLLILVCGSLLTLGLTGCVGVPASNARQLIDTAGADHIEYVEADADLTEQQRQTWRDLWASFDRLTTEAER